MHWFTSRQFISFHFPTVKSSMAPEREQTVCLSCGLCCDGTLFGHAVLKPGEKGNLPSLIEQRVFMIGEKDYFRLPCLYFLGRCTIYSSKRADVCGSFRCRLLSEMSEGRISFEKALEIIKGAVIMRNSLQEEYRSFPESPGILPLTEIMKVLGNYHNSIDYDGRPDTRYELLLARCNIFEALLIKHFRPEGAFNSLVMKQDEGPDII